MKIGDVARETGLTEKAIRIYVEQGLVKPTVTQSTHRNSYDFSRENVHELERISITVETLQLWTEKMLANGVIDPEAYRAKKNK